MNSSSFLALIEKGNHLQKEDFHQLVKLHESFPFFQIPMVLAAKYEHAKGTENKEILHWAASLSPDRRWLKYLLENEVDFQHTYAARETKEDSPIASVAEASTSDEQPEIISPEKEAADQDKPDLISSTSEEQPEGPKADLIHPEEDLAKPDLEIPEEKETTQAKKEKEEAAAKKKKPKRKGGTDEILDSIKKKEKREIKDSRKKEQNDIIKAFSKKSIKLAAMREMEDAPKLEDLSKNSTQINDRLVSESYAKLLTQQGKKDAAKEIYQKLILKFPEKKAYFADLLKKLED